MPTRRTVRQGESLAQIAAEHDLAPETIWSAPDNRELARTRDNYNVLAPGDVLIIPDKRTASVSAAVGRRHTFRRKGVPAKLRLQLYAGETPRADLDYELICGVTTLTGTTTADGVLEHWVPTDLRRAILRLPGSPDVTIEIGKLDPIDSIAGVQARLRNLGYGCPLSGCYDGATAEAIRRFQARHELELTGTLDDATRAELERLHDTTDHPSCR